MKSKLVDFSAAPTRLAIHEVHSQRVTRNLFCNQFSIGMISYTVLPRRTEDHSLDSTPLLHSTIIHHAYRIPYVMHKT